MEKLLTFALKDNVLVNVSEVDNGLKCNCVCPKCNSPLVAKNAGKRKIAHFSHHSNVDCQGYYESAIHLLVKDLILKHKKLYLPNKMESVFEEFGFYFLDGMEHHYQLIKFDEIQLERRINIDDTFIVPDIIAKKDGKEVLIEIVFSHDVDEEKMKKIEKLGIPCLKIVVFDLDLDIKVIQKFLFRESYFKTWIFNPILEDKTRKFVAAMKQKELDDEKERKIKYELEREKEFERVSYLIDNFEMFDLKNQYSNCRLVSQAKREKFKDVSFSNLPILKEIVMSNKWNGKAYGEYFDYIYFKNEKIAVFDKSRSESTNKFFFKILKTAQAITEQFHCESCDFFKGKINIPGKTLVACSFKPKRN